MTDGGLQKNKWTLLGAPNREPQEYSRYIIGIYLPGSLSSIIFVLYSCGSLFGVPSRVPLKKGPFQRPVEKRLYCIEVNLGLPFLRKFLEDRSPGFNTVLMTPPAPDLSSAKDHQ